MGRRDDEETLLRAVVQQNATSIFLARQRAEEELVRARDALEAKTVELAESLAMMQATLEATTDAILATDDAGRVTAFNSRFVDLWGMPSELLERRDHEQLLRVIGACFADPESFATRVATIIATAPAESFDVLHLLDGRVIERFSRTQAVGARHVGRVWSYRDITERDRYETALRQAKTEAEAASRAKSSFLAMMSHELRTPLNAIAGYAELIDLGIHGPVTAQQRSALMRIQSSQRHLLTLIDEVLAHAKLESGTIEYQIRAVRTGAVLRDAESLVAPQARAKNVAIEIHAGPADLAVAADAERLQQVLVNLLSNAVKFTPPGGQVALSAAPVEDQVHIQVRDTGIGIPADQLEWIFEPFVQVRSELTRVAEGTGLGLAISRALARGMGGEVEVESRLGAGSTFTLRLPRAYPSS